MKKYYVTEEAKKRARELNDLITNMEEDFPKAIDLNNENYSNLNKSVIDLVGCFGIIKPWGEPQEVTHEQLITEGWEDGQISELESEGYLEGILSDAITELRDNIKKLGIMKLFNSPGAIEKTEELVDTALKEHRLNINNLTTMEHSMIFWIHQNIQSFKNMIDWQQHVKEDMTW